MQEIKIVSRWDRNKIIVCGQYESIKDCLEKNRASDLFGADLSGAYLYRADLSGVDLSGVDLSRADLCGANLSRADLCGADLSGAYLSGADLYRADLSEAYLSRADLCGAYLSGAYLSRAYLCGADLCGANLSGADLSGANLSGANLSEAYLFGVKNYVNSHDVFAEIIRRCKVENFTTAEWAIIGVINVHRICWDTIKSRYGKKAMPIFKKLTKEGFSEWEKNYKEVLK